MNIFICTSGTSIATNQCNISDIENQPPDKKESFKLELSGIEEQVKGFLSTCRFEKEIDKTSAEIKSLFKMGISQGDKVYFLVSDTMDGEICARLNKEFIEEKWNCEVILEHIKGLQASDTEIFRKQGLKNLLEKLIRLLEKYQYQDVSLNITGGYKSVIPYVTLLGMIYDSPVRYIYEKSQEVITLEKIPIMYDESLILSVENKLRRIENDTQITLDEWRDGIAYESGQKYDSLIEEENGHVTMSAIGLLFYEKFKIDYPPELERDFTAPNEKPIKLRDDHGKDILFAFAKRLVNSPFIKEIINSLPFNPKQTNPIKKCSENGQIEIVLTYTDAGYGLVVQTTGKNKNEAEIIAKILKNKYLS